MWAPWRRRMAEMATTLARAVPAMTAPEVSPTWATRWARSLEDLGGGGTRMGQVMGQRARRDGRRGNRLGGGECQRRLVPLDWVCWALRGQASSSRAAEMPVRARASSAGLASTLKATRSWPAASRPWPRLAPRR